MRNDIKGLSKAENAYINLFGVCPEIEKNIPLHSYKDMILFVEKTVAEEKERHEKIIDALKKFTILNTEHYKDIAGLIDNAKDVLKNY